MSEKLAGKVAIVTGSSTGIGAAIAREFGKAGAAVAVNYRTDEAGAREVVAAIEAAGGKAIAVQGDVSQKENADRLVAAAVEKFGRLDILVNNAAVPQMGTIDDFTEEFFRRSFDNNVLGPFLMISAALKHLKEGASIINIGSVATEFAPPAMSVYTATKAAIDGLTSVLANELGPRGIRVNALKPGTMTTERQLAYIGPESNTAKTYLPRTPLRRFGSPDEIGKAAVFLASDDSSYITGDHILVAGGFR